MITGTIRNSVNLTMMDNKWQQKKEEIEYLKKIRMNIVWHQILWKQVKFLKQLVKLTF